MTGNRSANITHSTGLPEWADNLDPWSNALQSWVNWLDAVGMAPSGTIPTFPILDRRDDINDTSSRLLTYRSSSEPRWLYYNEAQLRRLEEIIQSLSSSRVVVTQPGHGASTLARCTYERARDETILRRAIPVLISLEDFLPESYYKLVCRSGNALLQAVLRSLPLSSTDPTPTYPSSPSDELVDQLWNEAEDRADSAFADITAHKVRMRIESEIRFAIQKSLITLPWERVIQRGVYAEIIGASSAQTEDLEARRGDLQALLRFKPGMTEPEINARERYLREEALVPLLVPEQTRDLIAALDDNARGVRISLLLDLSATPIGRFLISDEQGEYLTSAYQTVLASFAAAIKNIEQQGAGDPKPTLPSLIDKTFFMSEPAWKQFDEVYSQQDQVQIVFPEFRPLDVFTMLAYHYPPTGLESGEGRRVEILSAVLDADYTQGMSSQRAISTETFLMLGEILAQMQINLDKNLSPTYQLRNRRAETHLRNELQELQAKFAKVEDRLTAVESNKEGRQT